METVERVRSMRPSDFQGVRNVRAYLDSCVSNAHSGLSRIKPWVALALLFLLANPSHSLAQPIASLPGESSAVSSADGFSPFEKKVSQPKYFPDEIENRVEESLMDGYLGNKAAIRSHYRYLLDQDKERAKKDQPLTGLSDNLLYLMSNLVRDRDAYVAALEDCLEAPFLEPDVEGAVRHQLKNDPFNQAQAALKGDKGNKTGSVVNSFLRPLNLAALGLNLFIPAAIDTALNAALHLGDLSRLTEQERMALVAYQEFLARYPQSQLRGKAQREADRIQQKKQEHDLDQMLERGKADLKSGDLDEAAEILKESAELHPTSAEATRLLEEVQKQQAQLESAKNRFLTVEEELSPISQPEKEDYGEMLLTWYVEGPTAVLQEGERFLSRYPKSPLADEVGYQMAMVQEAQGRYDLSRPLLENLSQERRRSNRGKRAEYALEHPPYNWQEEMARAQRQQQRETLKYALLGDRFAQDSVVMGSSELAMEGLSALQTLGIFNLMAMGYRTISTLIQNPVSHQGTIEMGESYLNRFPNLDRSGELHETLAKAYEKEGDLERAMLHNDLAGKLTEAEKVRNREKIAQGLLRYAQEKVEQEEGITEKRFYLETLLRDYSETQAAQKAIPEMVKLYRQEEGLLRISKRDLMENPVFYGANGINIKPELLDGIRKNREIAESGIVFITENLLKIAYDTEEGPEERLYRVNEEVFKRLQIVRFQEQYRTALTRKGDPTPREGQKFAYELGGDLSLRDMDLEAKLFRGDRGVFLGGDSNSPYAGFQFPVPFLDRAIPLNLKLSIRPYGVTLDPIIPHQGLPRDKALLYGE